MQVYVLTSEYLNVDSGDSEHRVDGVYETFEQAQKAMEQEIKDARTDFEGVDYEEDNYVKGDMSWSIWEKEYYMSYHCNIKISEQTVIKK